MACTEISLSEKALKLLANAERGKLLRFNNLMITTGDFGTEAQEAYAKLFSPNRKIADEGAAVLQRILETTEQGEVGRKDVRSKIKSILQPKRGERSVLQLFTKDDSEKSARQLSQETIAMELLLDAIKSERVIQAKTDLSARQKEKLNREGVPTGLARLAPVIGRALAESEGKILSGGNTFNHDNYVKIGMKILRNLEEQGFLTIDDSPGSAWIPGNAVDENKDPLSRDTASGSSVRFNAEALKSLQVAGNRKFTEGDLLGVLKQMSRLTTPFREDPVKSESSKELKTDIKQTPEMKDTLRKLQEGGFKVAPGMQSFLGYLHSIYVEEGEEAFETKLKQEFGSTSANSFVEDMFGITGADDSIFADSAVGVKNSRVSPLVALMQHYEKVGPEATAFYVTYKQANNVRLFQREDMLNFQSNKVMNRTLLEASEPIDYEGDDIDDLLRRASIEFEIPIDILRGEDKDENPVTGTPEFEQLLEWSQRDTKGATRAMMKALANSKNNNGIGGKTPWDKHKALRAINDFRAGYSSGKITTGLLLESDATASGPVLKLLQNAHLPKVQIILKRMKLLPLDEANGETMESLGKTEFNKGGELVDFYMLAEEMFNDIDGLQEEPELVQLTKDIMKLTGNEGDFRSFIKGPIVRFTYGQRTTNNQRITGELLANEIILKGWKAVNEALTLLNVQTEVTRTELDSKTNYPQFTQTLTTAEQLEMRRVLGKEIGNSVGKLLVKEILDPTYDEGAFDGTRESIDTVFEVIRDSTTVLKNDGNVTFKYMNPAAVATWLDKNPGKTQDDFPYAEHRLYRVIGDKKLETLVPNEEGEDSLQQLYHPNQTSAHVLPTHASDATVLTRAIAKVYDAVSKDPRFTGMTPENISMMLVHDAVYLPPKLASIVEKAYEQEIINVSANYDIVGMMLKEAAYKYARMKYETDLETDPDAKFVELTVEEFGAIPAIADKHPKLAKVIQENIDNRAIKRELLNRNEKDQPRKQGEAYKVIPFSFANDTSDDAMAKIQEKYDKRIGKKVKEKEPTKAEAQEETDIEEESTDQGFDGTGTSSVDHIAPPSSEKVGALVDMLESGKPHLILDTETTGNRVESDNAVVHQIAYRRKNVEGAKKKSPPIVIDLPITQENIDKLTSGFIDFYADIHGLQKEIDADPSNDAQIVGDHINAKAAKQNNLKGALAKLQKELDGGIFIAHNAQFDAGMLRKVEGLNIDSTDVHDSRDIGYMVRRDKLNEVRTEAQRINPGDVKQDMFIGDVTSQEALAAYYDIELGDAHNAKDDIVALEQLVDAMVADHKQNPPGATAGTGNREGEVVKSQSDESGFNEAPVPPEDDITPEVMEKFASSGVLDLIAPKGLRNKIELYRKTDKAAFYAIIRPLINFTRCK